MSLLKKASAVSLCAAMTLTLSSCNLGGADTTYGAEINGYKVPAGVFITMQMNAYYDAMDRTASENGSSEDTSGGESASETVTTPFTNNIIDSVPVRDWINDEATKSMQKFVAVEQKFDELGLAFEDNENEKIRLYVDSIWEYYGQMYESLGVSENSQILISLNTEKRSLIFDKIYGEGGEKEVSEDEIRNYLLENYARVNYIKMELKDAEGNLLKSEGKEEAKKMADDYISRAGNGEDFNALIKEYNEYRKKLSEEAGEETELTGAEAYGVEEDNDNTTVITKTGIYPSAEMIEKAFDGSVKAGDIFFVESADGESYFVVQMLDLFSDENYYDNNKNLALHRIKDDEFSKEIESWAASQNVVRNEAAYKRYKIEKFMED